MDRSKHEPDTLRRIHTLLIDMDGVLYRGHERLPGAREFLKGLAREKVPFILATNNSTLTPEQYVDKLAHMGIEVTEDTILTSGQASALYLFAVNLIGLGIGPSAVAWCTDYLYKDEALLRYSLVTVGVSAHIIAIGVFWLGLKPYRDSVERLKAWERANV